MNKLRNRIDRLAKRARAVAEPREIVVYAKRDGESDADFAARKNADSHPDDIEIEVRLKLDGELREPDDSGED